MVEEILGKLQAAAATDGASVSAQLRLRHDTTWTNSSGVRRSLAGGRRVMEAMYSNQKEGRVEVVLLGVDGSDCASAALDFAVREASLRAASLRIICAGKSRCGPRWDHGYQPGPVHRLPPACGDRGRPAVARASELEPLVPCEGEVLEGQAAGVLNQGSHDAYFLVVGSCGHGGFASLLLGSVTQAVPSRPLPGDGGNSKRLRSWPVSRSC